MYRVYRKADAPASPEVVAASTVAMVGATMAQMFNSPAGKTKYVPLPGRILLCWCRVPPARPLTKPVGRYFELHCTALLAELQYALRHGEHPDATFVISPPSGDTDVRIHRDTYEAVPKPSAYGEADMIVPIQARRYGGTDARRLVVTIDTDSLVQCIMLGMTKTQVWRGALARVKPAGVCADYRGLTCMYRCTSLRSTSTTA